MLLRETGFTFGGIHSRRDMGLLYAEKDGHIAIPEIKRNSYKIAGMSGTVLLPGEAWQPFNLEGTLYPAEEPATQAAAQVLLRNVSAWLTAGRQQLIFDYEPSVYYLAELSAASKWSLRNWFGGELPIRFTAQPFAISVTETSATKVITGGDWEFIALNLDTGRPAPLKVQVENIGRAPINYVRVYSGVDFADMSLTTGNTLLIDMEPPAGATIGDNSALCYATSFAPLTLGPYDGGVYVAIGSEGGSSIQARVTVSARGRW